jgi:hypothetical protein
MDNKLKILIAFPFIIVIILFITAGYIPFKTGLTESEDRILTFTPSIPALKERQEISASSEIKIPFHFSSAAREEIQAKDVSIVTDTDYNDGMLSLIVVSGKRKMAIIRGVLVREGDIIGGMVISKIEPERVLLKNKTERWLYLEKAK